MSEAVINEAQIIAWRHHIHRNPEPAWQEYETAAYIEQALKALPGLVIERPTPTSVVATLTGGAGAGKTVALRADIDALPVKESTGAPFCSQRPGFGHMCGHDTHAAMLMGTALALSGIRERLRGKVKFIFQHAEEVPPGGAAELVRAGVLDGVDCCIGMHVVNDPVGLIRILEDPMVTTTCDTARIRVTGKGSHSSRPHLGADPVLAVAHMVLGLHTIVSRNISPEHFAVVSPNVVDAGTAENIIPDSAELTVNVRTKDEADRALILERVSALCRGIASDFLCSAELRWEDGAKGVRQDLALVADIKAMALAKFGPERVVSGRGQTFSEDFSEYNEAVASCMYFTLGGGESPYANHHPKFLPSDRCLAAGTEMQVAVIEHLLG